MRETQYRSSKWLPRAAALSFGAFAVVHSGYPQCNGTNQSNLPITTRGRGALSVLKCS
jgi:hypothetical protein